MSAIRQKFGRSLMQQSSLNTARTAGLSPAAAQQSKKTIASIWTPKKDLLHYIWALSLKLSNSFSLAKLFIETIYKLLSTSF